MPHHSLSLLFFFSSILSSFPAFCLLSGSYVDSKILLNNKISFLLCVWWCCINSKLFLFLNKSVRPMDHPHPICHLHNFVSKVGKNRKILRYDVPFEVNVLPNPFHKLNFYILWTYKIDAPSSAKVNACILHLERI